MMNLEDNEPNGIENIIGIDAFLPPFNSVKSKEQVGENSSAQQPQSTEGHSLNSLSLICPYNFFDELSDPSRQIEKVISDEVSLPETNHLAHLENLDPLLGDPEFVGTSADDLNYIFATLISDTSSLSGSENQQLESQSDELSVEVSLPVPVEASDQPSHPIDVEPAPAETEDMDLSKKGNHYVPESDAEAAVAMMQLSSGSRAGFYVPILPSDPIESESESQDSSYTSVIVKRPRLEKEEESCCSRSGDDTRSTPKAKISNRTSRRRREKKEFMHQKDDPSDPIAQRARYAKSYRERKKQEHEVEVTGLRKQIAERDARIEQLEMENDKMTEQLTKATLSRQETVKFSENIAAVINAVNATSGIDVVVTPGLGELNSPKLGLKECDDIAKQALDSQRFTLVFDYLESEKKLVAQGKPGSTKTKQEKLN